jgi:hypothetical protein
MIVKHGKNGVKQRFFAHHRKAQYALSTAA